MDIDGFLAVISYEQEIEMLRGEFVGLNGGADFYAMSTHELEEEGRRSLTEYLEVCKEEGIEPRKVYSGRFNLRINPELHERLSYMAAASHKSLNELIGSFLQECAANDLQQQ